jgi:hypothetical protein
MKRLPICEHNWRPYTLYKAKCSKCGQASPWTMLVKDADERASGTVRALRDAARAARPLRRHGDQLRKLFAVLSEAGVK